jgi:NADH-quinone oxidoreductase subunit M
MHITGLVLLTIGLLVRCGVAPVHGWQVDLVERASFGTTILYLVPLAGVYGIVRLVLPIAPNWIMQWIAIMSLITAIYSAGMAMVQTSPRKLFVYLLISNSSLLLVGLETLTPMGLTGSLSLWMSQGFSLAAFGMTIRAIEGRVGRVSLAHFQGLYEQMPLLGGFFVLAGLASIGFPGTVGFVAYELLIEAVIDVYSYSGAVVVCVMAINGIAVMRSYFRLFTGHAAWATISMQPRWYERIAIVVFSVFILVGGFIPQPGIATRYHAAQEMIQRRIVPKDADSGSSPGNTDETGHPEHDHDSTK